MVPPPHTHGHAHMDVCSVVCVCVRPSTNKYSLYTHTRRVVVSLVTSMAKCTEVWIAPSTSFHMFL